MPNVIRRRRGRPRRTRAVAFTLGWELEANRRASRTPSDVLLSSDGSVSGDGSEYKIADGVVNRPNDVLERLRTLVSDSLIRVDRTCGYHVHIGLQNETSANEKLFASWMVVLARAIEEDAFQAVPESRRHNQYCRRYSTNRQSVMARTYYMEKYRNERYYWLNVVEMFRPSGIRTVEIRLLGNVRRFSYLLAWTSVCQLMARAAWRLMSDPSALLEETDQLKRYFETIRTRILANTNAAQTIAAANELAIMAGFIVRASAQTEALPDGGLNPQPPRRPVESIGTDEDLLQEIDNRLNAFNLRYPFATPLMRRPDENLSVFLTRLTTYVQAFDNAPRASIAEAQRLWRLNAGREPYNGETEVLSTYVARLRTLSNQNQNSSERRSLSCAG